MSSPQPGAIGNPTAPENLPRYPTTPENAELRSRAEGNKFSVIRHTQSPKERVNDILEGARARRVAMGQTSADEDMATSPRSVTAESSADEETHIVRRAQGENMNYQGTRIRSKPSAASIRRSGRISSPEEVHEGARDGRELDGEGHEHESWWARMLSEYGSIELENKGSVARDHLALERTFLAWLRTSLAFASIGIAITQLFRLNTAASSSKSPSSDIDQYQHLRQMGKPLGATFLGISIVMLFVGAHRYFESQHWIIRGKFPASRGSIMLVAMITFALMVTSLVVVVVVEPRAFEKR